MSESKATMSEKVRQELKELTSAIGTMMEAFRKIRQPIQESSEKVPTTAHHLEKVTEQTEQATHQVLDIIEAIANRESEIGIGIDKVSKLIPEDTITSTEGLGSLIADIKQNSEKNLNDSYSIMDALQFQDITTQQIDHAISLLDDVEGKLMTMLQTVGLRKDIKVIRPPKKKRAFDPNASFDTNGKNQQQEIDKIISKMD
ncbi:MAG: protein phosphatase CheZ [candidate division Zixibacteria bacterium]|nr:protein phosphatase CheZ [candidate division Zixibacteria bacterium]